MVREVSSFVSESLPSTKRVPMCRGLTGLIPRSGGDSLGCEVDVVRPYKDLLVLPYITLEVRNTYHSRTPVYPKSVSPTETSTE